MLIAELNCDECGAPVSFDEDEWYALKYESRETPETVEIICHECKHE